MECHNRPLGNSAVSAPWNRARRGDWIGLAVLTLPGLLYSMDLTILNLAIPALSVAIKPTAEQLLWILDIYGFMLAGMLIPMAAVADRIGRRRLLLWSAGVFAVASIAAAFSRSAATLIAMRAALGVASAAFAPATLSLIREMFQDSGERTTAVSVWVAGYSAGAAIGPVVGGLLLQYFWWGSVFLAGVPAMLLLLILGPMFLPEHRESNGRPIDLLSALLSLATMLSTAFGLKRIAESGTVWSSALWIATGLIAGWQFIRRQALSQHPMINLKLFRTARLRTALGTYALASFVSFGSFVFVAQYMQLVLDLSSLAAGLWSVPRAFAMIVGSAMTPAMARYLTPANRICAGLALAAIGFVMLSCVSETTAPATFAIVGCTYSLGLAYVYTPITDLIISGVSPEQAGEATAIAEAGFELGGALGVAILGSIGAVTYRDSLHHVTSTVALQGVETLGAAIRAIKHLDMPLQAALLHVHRAAFLDGLRVVAMTAAVSLAVAAILVAHYLSALNSRGR